MDKRAPENHLTDGQREQQQTAREEMGIPGQLGWMSKAQPQGRVQLAGSLPRVRKVLTLTGAGTQQ